MKEKISSLIEKHKKRIASLNQEHHRELFSLIIEDLEQLLRGITPSEVEEDVVERMKLSKEEIEILMGCIESEMDWQLNEIFLKKLGEIYYKLKKHLTPAVKQESECDHVFKTSPNVCAKCWEYISRIK